jgi:hypothetical protein
MLGGPVQWFQANIAPPCAEGCVGVQGAGVPCVRLRDATRATSPDRYDHCAHRAVVSPCVRLSLPMDQRAKRARNGRHGAPTRAPGRPWRDAP